MSGAEPEIATASGLSWRRLGLGLGGGLVVAAVTIAIVAPHAGNDLATATRTASEPLWLVAALVALLVALAADAATLVVLVRRLSVCTSVFGTGAVAIESGLIGGATSFGGLEVPYQIMRLRGLDVPLTRSTSVILVKAMVHISVLAVVAAVALLPFGAAVLTPLQRWIILGVLVALILGWLVGTAWLRWPLGLSRLPRSLGRRLEDFSEAVRMLRGGGVRLAASVTILQLTYWVAMFSLIPMILHALGWRGPLVPIVVGQAVLQMIMPLSPLPGGAGVAEIGYLGLLGRSIPKDLTVASLLIWRVYTWVMPMALGALVLALRTATRRRPRAATQGLQSNGEIED
jgi:glycosyltransferase 2 family protein